MLPPQFNIGKIIGHRGACHYAPENTLASLNKAHEHGATWIEFDAMLSLDGILLAIHDERVERTTNGHGSAAKLPYAQIAELDAGSWFSAEFAGEKVPTALEFLTQAERLQLGVNLEIKPARHKDLETAQAVVQLLEQHRFDQRLNLLVSSFSLQSLAVTRALNSHLPLGLILDHWFNGWQQDLQQLNCVSLSVDYKILTAKKVAEIKNLGVLVLAFTVNDPLIAERLYSWGVDAVFSDSLLIK